MYPSTILTFNLPTLSALAILPSNKKKKKERGEGEIKQMAFPTIFLLNIFKTKFTTKVTIMFSDLALWYSRISSLLYLYSKKKIVY